MSDHGLCTLLHSSSWSVASYRFKLSNSLRTLKSHWITMVAAIVYTVGDTLFMGMVWISSTSLAKLIVLRVVGRVNPMTVTGYLSPVYSSWSFVLQQIHSWKIYVQSMTCFFFIIMYPFLPSIWSHSCLLEVVFFKTSRKTIGKFNSYYSSKRKNRTFNSQNQNRRDYSIKFCLI